MLICMYFYREFMREGVLMKTKSDFSDPSERYCVTVSHVSASCYQHSGMHHDNLVNITTTCMVGSPSAGISSSVVMSS